MKPHCPECQAEIAEADFNVTTAFAQCRKCGLRFTVVDLSQPPPGVCFEEFDGGFEIRVRQDAAGAWFVTLWAGLATLVFIYFFAGVIQASALNFPIVLCALLWVFMILAVLFVAVRKLMGQFVVRILGDSGSVTTKLGPFERTRDFDWGAVAEVWQQHRNRSRQCDNDPNDWQIILNGADQIAFGEGVRGEELYFVCALLREMVRRRDVAKKTTTV